MSNVKDLSRILADKQKLDLADAEKFLSLMIDVVNDGLLDNKLVKIKGLGTFKVTSVSPRESVDVNTGERILIEGRDKISFSPDNAMKELVNRPFSQFETVVVNDGVDFGQDEQTGDDPLDETSEDATDDVEETVETSVEQKEEEQVEQKDEEVVKTNEDNSSESYDKEIEKQKINSTVNDEVKDVVDSIVGQKTEEAIEQNIELPVEPEKESGTVDIKIKEVTPEPEPVVESAADKVLEHHNQNVIETLEEIDSNEENSDESEPVKNTAGVNKLLIISIFALFILSAGALWYMYNEVTERNSRIESLISRLEERKATPKAKPVKSMAVKPAPVVKKSTEKAKSPDVITKNNVKVESKPAVTDEYAVMNNSDARVRTGAYKIVGVQKTLKVKAGQTLSSISRLYFGPGMECYIEVMNGKKELKEGEIIKIPELKNKHSR